MTRKSGYSVFEVLIAFAIMALVLSALLPGQARLLARATGGEDAVLAHDLALSRLASLAVAEPLSAGESTKRHGDWQTVERVTMIDSGEDQTRYAITVIVLNSNSREIAQAASLRNRAND